MSDDLTVGKAEFYNYDNKGYVYNVNNNFTSNNKNNNFKHLMVDIESLGTNADSVVLSIGAVPFNMDGTMGKSFEVYPIVETQSQIGRKMDWSTIQWWFKQSDVVRSEQSNALRSKDLNQCLSSLNTYCQENLDSNFKVWGNGFDIPLLNHAYNQYNMKTPWSYKNVFDCRTLVWLSKISTRKYSDENDVQHNALSDAKFQIRFVVDANHIINL